jgi:hypothetical protein
MNGSDFFYLFYAVAYVVLGFIWEHRLGVAVLLALIFLVMIVNNLATLVSTTGSMAKALERIREVLESSAAEDRSGKAQRDLRRRAQDGDTSSAWAIGLSDWIKENPDESYRWLHKVPSDACALRCPRDHEACWQNYCLQLGGCGYLREHSHASDEEMANCELCKFTRHATLRFRDRLRRAEEVARTGEPEDQA